MVAKIMDGNILSQSIKEKIKNEVKNLNPKPGLAMILVGDNFNSKLYVNIKEKACEEVGIKSDNYFLPENTENDEIIEIINKLNKDKSIHGILVQLPLPPHINKNKILKSINSEKDVDGLNEVTLGKISFGEENISPCTPKGIIKLLEHYNIELEGKNCAIINHSNVIGRPLSTMLLNRNATVTVCHIKTTNLSEHTKKADIIISGTGKPKLITKEMIKEGAIIIDVGIIKVNGKIQGDVDFENVKVIASYITPVPGGVGPMTIAMLLENTLIAFKNMQN